MGWFSKTPDPISDRARALNQEIAQLEAQIKKLDARLKDDEAQPQIPASGSAGPGTRTNLAVQEPIFEHVDRETLKPGIEPASHTEHFNELGVRKYDLPALLRRWRSHFRGPSTTNPKLVNYLAAGGLQGLRPLRYERRVTRNRFIALSIGFLILLLWIIVMFFRDL